MKDRSVSRRAVLGGAAAGLAGAWLAPTASSASTSSASAGSGSFERAVAATASRFDRALVGLRRDIHRHPEVAGEEARTSAVVARWLREAGLSVTTGIGGHGVVGVLSGARPGPTVAYRADMDAVPPDEQIGGGTTLAHVCGHDIHTTVGVGIAQVLSSLRHRLAGRIVFVFQPGEESLTGAAAMLSDHVLDRFRPREIHALHCGPFPVGEFIVAPGTGLPGQDRGTISLTGPDAAARGDQLAAAINALGTVPRPSGPADLERLVDEVQMRHGPLERFVFMQAQPVPVAGGVDVRFSYRCWPENRYVEVRQAVGRLGPAVFPNDPFPALVTPEREGHAVQRYLRRTVGPDRTGVMHAPIPYSGEDFALFLKRIPGTYSFLGVRRPGSGIETSYPHYITFDPDERAIGYGVRAMAGWLATRAGSN
jgi:metal-dependent amidase/aminoacylase/carboxypeptidase family protein